MIHFVKLAKAASKVPVPPFKTPSIVWAIVIPAVTFGAMTLIYLAIHAKRQAKLLPGWGAGRSKIVPALAFSADGRRLAAAQGAHFHVWDVDSGASVAEINSRGWAPAPWSLALSPHGDLIAAAVLIPRTYLIRPHLHFDIVRVWRVGTGRVVQRFSDFAPLSGNLPSSVAFSPDGKWIAAGLVFQRLAATRTHLRVWDIQTGELISKWARDVAGMTATRFTSQNSIAAQPLGLLSVEPPALWNGTTGQVIQTYLGCEASLLLAFSPDAGSLAGGGVRRICIWNVHTGKKLQQVPPPHGPLAALAFASRQSLLFAAARDGVFALNLSNGTLSRSCPVPQLVAPAQFSPDGKLLAWGDSHQAVVHLWDIHACREMREFSVANQHK